ncbi:MAG: DNA-protecting protein DprA, partial [Candidatus Eremiobacteraeota bacterium]|nr:DNA-protecting protein DprA [Candidatus Eremiobacteraeota bacterium]
GVCVVSGLALGIDGAAHAGALDGGGLTIGVLGGGHRHFFPRSNLALARKMIAAGGGVTSPYPPEREVFPGQFLERNAIVAGLTDAVVVVEAAARSGALNTASHAANLGISVLAFPGDVDRPKVAGCLALIRDSATLVRGADDVLEAIGRRALRAPSRTPQLDAESRRVVAALAGGEVPFDRLVEQLALEPGGLAAILMELELRGLIEARAGAHYALANG